MLARPVEFIDWYEANVRRGPDYYRLGRPPDDQSADQLALGDLAWAVLLEGRPSSKAAQSLLRAPQCDISRVPKAPLHELQADGRELVVGAILELVKLDGFRSSLATKVLHPKRPATVPVLDNRAIFGSFMVESFQPGLAPSMRSVSTRAEIAPALDAIHESLERPDNQESWRVLEAEFTMYERVELFDMLWWATIRSNPDSTEGGLRLSP